VVFKRNEDKLQGLHNNDQKKCAALIQQLANVTTQLMVWDEALKEVQNELQVQKQQSEMFMSFVDGESNKVDIRKVLRELEQLQQ
jgi:hypothetical protein